MLLGLDENVSYPAFINVIFFVITLYTLHPGLVT